jgi:hypothetical protein
MTRIQPVMTKRNCPQPQSEDFRRHFAMKARAARTRDIDDLRLLADIIGVDSAGTALRICADFYPDEPVSPRSAAVLQELFG